MKDGCTRKEMIRIPLVDDQEADFITNALSGARELVLGTAQRIAR
jgi:hypothetical protein